MKTKTILTFCGILAIFGALLIALSKKAPNISPPPLASKVASPPISLSSKAKLGNPKNLTPAAPLSTLDIHQQIQEAATSYDPAQLETIISYLTHENPELRESALDALLIMGESAAAEPLRQAAKNLSSPHEMVKYLDAADFLAQPSAR